MVSVEPSENHSVKLPPDGPPSLVMPKKWMRS